METLQINQNINQNKTNKILFISGIILFASVLIYIYFDNKKRKKELQGLSDNDNDKVNTGNSSIDNTTTNKKCVPDENKKCNCWNTDEYPIQICSKGEKVKEVQKLINKAIDTLNIKTDKIDEDGYFGKKTEEALIKTFKVSRVLNENVFNYFKNYIEKK